MHGGYEMILKYNGSILKVNSGESTLTYSDPFVQYDYMTFKCAANYNGKFDQACGCAKVYTNSYMKNLDNDSTATLKYAGGDAMEWNVLAGTTYMCYWNDQDIADTKNYSIASWNNSAYPVVYATNGGAGAIGELYSMDFWNKPYWTNWNMSSCTLLPQEARNIHRGDALLACNNLFKNAPITNSIEKFIHAMQSACPNLTSTSGCFAGCTSASDYAYCQTQYPAWF